MTSPSLIHIMTVIWSVFNVLGNSTSIPDRTKDSPPKSAEPTSHVFGLRSASNPRLEAVVAKREVVSRLWRSRESGRTAVGSGT